MPNEESHLKKKIDLYAMFLKKAYIELSAYRCFLQALVERYPDQDLTPLLDGFLNNEVVRAQSEKKLAELDSLLDRLPLMSPDEIQEEFRKWSPQHSPSN